jgi:hypothetical protein
MLLIRNIEKKIHIMNNLKLTRIQLDELETKIEI